MHFLILHFFFPFILAHDRGAGIRGSCLIRFASLSFRLISFGEKGGNGVERKDAWIGQADSGAKWMEGVD